MGCFSTIAFLAGFVLVMVSFIRWFEQTAEAVDNGWWSKVMVLLMMPFAVWFFPSRVSAGRTTPVPRHQPVRGFGSLPKSKPADAAAAAAAPASGDPSVASSRDRPPPGTPTEFLSIPKVTRARPRAPVDPDKIAKLKQKMREQGMLPPE